ncbi:MAG: hypothetical protein EOP56_17080 [Sphingobacteriales bacterium]|nr:MAG: hypothetical protein EOP56_17080 [Sphingobacteriales bacterium]
MNCITLLSDFGLQDSSVAAAKGILMQYNPDARLVDISHLIEPFHLQQAAYILAAAYEHFPKGTCHLLLFDIFYGDTPRLVLCEKNGYYFLAPDNGILPLAFGNDYGKVWKYFELTAPFVFKDWIHAAAKVCNELKSKKTEQLELEPYELKNAPQHCQARVDGNTVECHVIHIDRFENVIINMTKEQFETVGKGRPFRIEFMRDEQLTELSDNYLVVKEGEKLCRFNSTGYLEIAINRGRAASLFGLKLFKERHLIYNTIKIYFE